MNHTIKHSRSLILGLSLGAWLSACSGGDNGGEGSGGSNAQGGKGANGGSSNASGGNNASGGSNTSNGGASNGGNTASGGGGTGGGANNGGGNNATGGANNGGGNNATGGANNGGAQSKGGSSNANGGSNNGGSNNGGSNSGGSNNGGSNNGGSSSGGKANGGSASGGTASGGASNGGKANGGSANSGSANGGNTSAGGKAAGGTGSGGTNAMGGTGSGGSGTSCNVAPVNPNATQQAKNLLCYLYSQYGNHVLSGQQETSWSSPEADISWYTSNTAGKLPAILGGDYLYPSGTTTRAIAYWNAGGITMIRYHMGAPPNADTYENSKGTANINNVLTAGTSENQSFVSKLDYAAGELAKLQAANVPVLWAPFHEVQANGWFWWSKGTGAQFVSLWKYMFDYFTNVKKLNNLVWLMPFSGTPSAAYYPGKAYLDLSGPDTYDTNQPFTGIFSASKGIIGSSVPIPLHETGLIPNPDNMFPSAAPWVLFNIWAGYQKDGTHNTTSNIQNIYKSPYLVTRDEVPNLK